MLGRLVGLLVIAFSLIIQVFAVTALFDAVELFDTAWREPFYTAGKLYAVGINVIANAVGGLIGDSVARFPIAENILGGLPLPCWWVHGLAIYAGASLGIWGGGLAFGNRQLKASAVARGGLFIAWPMAIASMLIQGLRNQPLASFTREHNGVTFFYIVAVLAMYAGANWANINVLTGPPGPNQEVMLKNSVQCPMIQPKTDLPEGVAGFLGIDND
ncbi:MAG: hypothetical protein AAGH41_07970 [Pseudomonadota bacterium]